MSEPTWPPPATARLHLTLQEGMLGAPRRGPWVRVDDTPVPTTRGENVIEVTPGHHTISIVSAAQIAGRTEGDFLAADGEAVHLWYSPPFSRFSTGRIGPEPQPDESRRFLALVGLVMVAGVVVEAVRR